MNTAATVEDDSDREKAGWRYAEETTVRTPPGIGAKAKAHVAAPVPDQWGSAG